MASRVASHSRSAGEDAGASARPVDSLEGGAVAASPRASRHCSRTHSFNRHPASRARVATNTSTARSAADGSPSPRSEEHTSELQSQSNLVCRLLLEKKKKKK